MEHKGKVVLVGAGPGDPELLTLKGKRILEQADVVVYDRLMSPEVLALMPETAEKIDVGKNVGNHPVPQDQINRILLEKALEGKQVVRLKGGDPFVFGRGGEELELLKEHNIPFEEVPGITSAIAAAAYAGIPVTHRDYCSSLHIITGHARAGGELSIDFSALVRLNGTLVFLMSVANAGKIADGLRQAGMDGTMPCAVVERGTYPAQRKILATLDTLASAVEENGVQSPAVILVGKVCGLSEKFDWFSAKPLKGKRILVTQPQKKQSKFLGMLRELGADAVGYPCIETEPVRPLEADPGSYSVLVFTSAAGVDSYFSWLEETGRDARCLFGKKIFCVGSQTAAEWKKHGITADFVPSVYDGEHLARELLAAGAAGKEDCFLLLRADIASPELPEILRENGMDVTEIAVYRTKAVCGENPPDLSQFDVVTFTSKSCVEGLARSLGRQDFTGIKALCIGAKTAACAEQYGFTAVTSEKATLQSMAEELIRLERI